LWQLWPRISFTTNFLLQSSWYIIRCIYRLTCDIRICIRIFNFNHRRDRDWACATYGTQHFRRPLSLSFDCRGSSTYTDDRCWTRTRVSTSSGLNRERNDEVMYRDAQASAFPPRRCAALCELEGERTFGLGEHSIGWTLIIDLRSRLIS